MLLYRYPNLNWSQLLTQAESWGCKRMLYLGLYLAHHWFRSSLPDSILKLIGSEPTVVNLAGQVDQRIFERLDHSHAIGITRYQLQVRERLQDKAVYIESVLYWLLKGRLTVPA
jgi:hypothetical protein